MINGVKVLLCRTDDSLKDPFGAPIGEPSVYAEIDDVLVSPVSSEDNVANLQLYGREAVYELCFPKSVSRDTLEGVRDRGCVIIPSVSQTFKFAPLGEPVGYIESNVPLRWNLKLKVALRR